MGDDLADLGVAAAAVGPRRQGGEALGLRHPVRGAAFPEPAIVDKLHVESADRRRLAEHVRLQVAGGIPRGLPAHGRIEREDQPAAPARLRRRRERLYLGEEGVDLRARGGRRRRAPAVRALLAIIGHGAATSAGGQSRPLKVAISSPRRNACALLSRRRSAARGLAVAALAFLALDAFSAANRFPLRRKTL